MKEDNGNGKVDREKLNREKEPEELDIVAEIIKLYQEDPISQKVIQHLLIKNKIMTRNAVESIALHKDEILLNIVRVYKKMWDARGNIMLKAMQSGNKPIRIIIKKGEKNESIRKTGETKIGKKNGINEGNGNGRESRGEIHKKDSHRKQS